MARSTLRAVPAKVNAPFFTTLVRLTECGRGVDHPDRVCASGENITRFCQAAAASGQDQSSRPSNSWRKRARTRNLAARTAPTLNPSSAATSAADRPETTISQQARQVDS